jgi:Spy/CpxP family protein refolding chaperone
MLEAEVTTMRFAKLLRYGAMAGMVATAGCGSVATADPLGTAAAELGGEPGGPHGAMGAIREALESVDLRADQKAEIEKLAADAKTRHAPVLAAREALAKAVADQVAAGAIDRKALAAPFDALLAAVDQVRPADRAAIVRLHDILDKTQRAKLVDALEAKFEHHAGKRWGGHGPGMGPGGPWIKELNLSDAQRTQIKAALLAHFADQKDAMRAAWGETRTQGKQILESFRQDTFRLDDGALPMFSRDRIAKGVTKVLDAAEIVVPILTPEQRTKAAAKIRTMPHPAF